MVTPKKQDLTTEIARPAQTGLRSVWQWRPLASMTPAMVADVLRRAAMGDAHDFLLAADDIAEKDLHYRAVLQTRTLAVAGLPIDIQPWDDSPAAQKAAELVTDAVRESDLSVLITHLMDAVAKGYAVAEIVWETSGDVWYPKQILRREAHWFTWDRDTGRLLRLVDGSMEGAEIPAYRMIVHAPPVASGIPLLGGVARSALWAWVFKSYAMRDWARFAELFGQPIRVGKYHQGASPEDVAVLKQAAFSLGSDAAAVIPQEMALELIESGSKSASADLYHQLIDYLDRQVSKAVLGQTMTTDDGASLSQARVHNDIRRELLEADARAMAATLTRDLIAPIVRLNLGDAAPLPVLKLLVEDPNDLTALADHVVKLTGAGMPIPQWWVREKFGIPEVKDGEPVLNPAPSGPTGPNPAGEPLANRMANRAETSGSPMAATPDVAPAVHALHATRCGCAAHAQAAADAFEALADEAAGDWQAQLAPAADAVQTLLDEAAARGATAAEILDIIAAHMPDIHIDALAERLARAQFAARLAGVHGREAG
ncbi:phage gp29-like protein [Sulfuritortus calidifontis]|uniref:Phage gp29-like protein n=1 Tax=Sulfuritortus calidifontis TaxID=1914471 RepID=A0A4R3JTH5_9PROT|nr:DUF935 domain-containing protein [Sulfuritortus calidifontis]TCS70685.1 phage gp29-like protein [Sulfuritortus calidifontis]